MGTVQQRYDLHVYHDIPYVTLGVAAATAVAGIPIMVMGQSWLGLALVALGVCLFLALAQDTRVAVDRAARVARIMRRSLWGRSTIEVPFAAIRDVALERNPTWYAWRPVFVCEDGARVPWTRRSSYYRDQQSRAVAGARALGGWNALPIASPPTLKQVSDALWQVRLVGMIVLVASLVPLFFDLWFRRQHPAIQPITPIPFVGLGISTVAIARGCIHAATMGVDVPVV